MIVDDILNFKKYLLFNKYFNKVFNFLNNIDLNCLNYEKLIIEKDNIFAIILNVGDSFSSKTIMESHQKYIDIHFVVEGTETLGWKSLKYCDKKNEKIDIENDSILYKEKDFTRFKINKNTFVIFFPEDVHIPSLETEKLKKIIVKVKI